jgi:hypothetical protein
MVGSDKLQRILYIAGIPRTGSTILGQILGDIPEVTFLGELNQFWRRLANSELCSCGHSLPECQFWAKVIKEGFGELTSEDSARLNKLEWAVRRKLQLNLLTPMRTNIKEEERFQQVAEARMRLYCAIADVAKTPWIVDSGKDPWVGSILAHFLSDRFHTVHVVRDPRGVAFSWQKAVRSDSEPGYMPRKGPGLAALSWVSHNLTIQFLLQRLSASYSRLRYEDLAADPEAVVSNLTRSIGIDVNQLSSRQSKNGPGDLHWVAGNPRVRQSSRARLEIKLDEEWRVRLPRTRQWLVVLICGIMLPLYGYKLRRPREVYE